MVLMIAYAYVDRGARVRLVDGGGCLLFLAIPCFFIPFLPHLTAMCHIPPHPPVPMQQQLVRGYRESRRVPLHLEQRLLLQLAPDYDRLPLLHKVEVRASVV